MTKQHIMGATIIAIVLSGVAFYEGMQYATKQTPQISGRGGRQGGVGQGAFMRGAGGMTTGEILSKDNLSITLKLLDGGSKIVFYGSSTAIMKTASGTPSDLTPGMNAIISGVTNQDGSISASTIQLRSTQSKRLQ